MAQDWKDMLASLASSGAEGESDGEGAPGIEERSEAAPDPHAHPALHILLDKKGRKGKMATIIEGFEIDDRGVEEIASELKRKIGTGGSSRGGEILLQGDWRVKAAELLRGKGFKVKC